MDIVYTCRPGDNEELRYSLRSLANLPHDNVWIIGGKPDWYRGHFKQTTGEDKLSHATQSLTVACNDARISDDFILMNDDFYVLTRTSKIPTLHRGPIASVAAAIVKRNRRISSYVAAMLNTADYLRAHGIREPLSYELHTPMVFNKEKLAKVLPLRSHHRSMYGNLNGIGGTLASDVKVHDRDTTLTGRFASTSDKTFPWVRDQLQARFPKPSQYE